MKKEKQDPAGYKTEDTLKAEAKKRAEEQAALDALKKPVPPHKKKAENYWYHYKYHTIFGAVAFVLIAFFVKDMVFRTDPDASIIFASRSPVDSATLESLQLSLESVAEDYNGDGKVSIAVDYLYLAEETPPAEAGDATTASPGAMGGQQDYANTMKLTTLVAAAIDPLYLLDDGMYEYFQQMAAHGNDPEDPDAAPETTEPPEPDANRIFQSLDSVANADADRLHLDKTVLADDAVLAALPDVAFSLRPSATLPKDQEYHAYCEQLLQKLGEETK